MIQFIGKTELEKIRFGNYGKDMVGFSDYPRKVKE